MKRTSGKNSGLAGLDRRLVWHPYTQMKDYETLDPVVVSRAKGVRFFDTRGRWYYDLSSSWWSSILGHNIPAVNAAVNRQLRRFEHVIFAGTTNGPAVRLAELLLSLCHPGLGKVFYSDDGSTAVEAALKMSFQFWKNRGVRTKNAFVFFDRGYHGDTIGAMSVSGASPFNAVFKKLFFKSYSIPSPYCYRCPAPAGGDPCSWGCLDPLVDLLAKKHREIAGIILEPRLQAAGGMIVQPKGFLDRLAAICREYEIHIILDEVATGFGRTGKMFGHQHSRIEPDFVCVSKSLTNGTLPLAATLVTDEIYSEFYADFSEAKTFFHGHTFTGNPVSAAAAIATLETIVRDRLIPRSRPVSERLRKGLESFRSGPAGRFIGDIRHTGMVAAMELVSDPETKKPLDPALRFGWSVFREGLRRNLFWRPLGDVLYFFLPLTVRPQEIDDILERSRATLETCVRGLGRRR